MYQPRVKHRSEPSGSPSLMGTVSLQLHYSLPDSSKEALSLAPRARCPTTPPSSRSWVVFAQVTLRNTGSTAPVVNGHGVEMEINAHTANRFHSDMSKSLPYSLSINHSIEVKNQGSGPPNSDLRPPIRARKPRGRPPRPAPSPHEHHAHQRAVGHALAPARRAYWVYLPAELRRQSVGVHAHRLHRRPRAQLVPAPLPPQDRAL